MKGNKNMGHDFPRLRKGVLIHESNRWNPIVQERTYDSSFVNLTHVSQSFNASKREVIDIFIVMRKERCGFEFSSFHVYVALKN